MFLAAGGGIRVFPRGAAVFLQWALLGRQLRDAGGALGWLPCSRRRGRLGFGGVGAERAGRLGQAVYVAEAGRRLQAVHALHENGAVAHQLRGAELVHAVAAIGGVRVQRGGGGGGYGVVPPAGQPVTQRGGLHQVALGAVGGEPVAGLGERQRRVRVGSIQVPAAEEEEVSGRTGGRPLKAESLDSTGGVNVTLARHPQGHDTLRSASRCSVEFCCLVEFCYRRFKRTVTQNLTLTQTLTSP